MPHHIFLPITTDSDDDVALVTPTREELRAEDPHLDEVRFRDHAIQVFNSAHQDGDLEDFVDEIQQECCYIATPAEVTLGVLPYEPKSRTRLDLCYACVDDDSIYWYAYEKHSGMPVRTESILNGLIEELLA